MKSIILGSGTAIQTIYTYAAEDLQGESPVLRIMSASAERPPLTFKGTRTKFGIFLQTLVLFKDEENDWTPANAEDTIDLVEAQIAQVIYNPATWNQTDILSITSGAPSTVRRDVVQGETYLQELIPIIVEVKTDGKK